MWHQFEPRSVKPEVGGWGPERAVCGLSKGLQALCALSPMVSLSQVDHAKVLHYIGAGVAFPTSMLFLFLQSVLTYRMAKTRRHYWTGHLRSVLTALAFITLVFSILSQHQHLGKKCVGVKCVQTTSWSQASCRAG